LLTKVTHHLRKKQGRRRGSQISPVTRLPAGKSWRRRASRWG